MNVNDILSIIQLIGFFSFTVSATIIAAKKGADIIGALVFTLLTGFGGGFMRDLILGFHPPHMLSDRNYLLSALFCILLCILLYYLFFVERLKNFFLMHEHDFWIDFSDAIGLAVFCVCGVDVAVEIAGRDNVVLLIFCGVLTGVGGGVLRDVCSAELPAIFRKHIYILPTLVGASFYVFTYYHFAWIPHIPAMLVSIGIVVIIRVLAICFKWNLPTPIKKR